MSSRRNSSETEGRDLGHVHAETPFSLSPLYLENAPSFLESFISEKFSIYSVPLLPEIDKRDACDISDVASCSLFSLIGNSFLPSSMVPIIAPLLAKLISLISESISLDE